LLSIPKEVLEDKIIEFFKIAWIFPNNETILLFRKSREIAEFVHDKRLLKNSNLLHDFQKRNWKILILKIEELKRTEENKLKKTKNRGKRIKEEQERARGN
jgi:hypothetical protein